MQSEIFDLKGVFMSFGRKKSHLILILMLSLAVSCKSRGTTSVAKQSEDQEDIDHKGINNARLALDGLSLQISKKVELAQVDIAKSQSPIEKTKKLLDVAERINTDIINYTDLYEDVLYKGQDYYENIRSPERQIFEILGLKFPDECDPTRATAAALKTPKVYLSSDNFKNMQTPSLDNVTRNTSAILDKIRNSDALKADLPK